MNCTKTSKQLTNEPYMKIFRQFVPECEFEGTIYLSKLIEEREKFYSLSMKERLEQVINLGDKAKSLIKDDWFFCLANLIEKDTAMTRQRQIKARNILLRKNLIEVKLAGCPQRQFFKLNDDKIIEIVRKFNSDNTEE